MVQRPRLDHALAKLVGRPLAIAEFMENMAPAPGDWTHGMASEYVFRVMDFCFLALGHFARQFARVLVDRGSVANDADKRLHQRATGHVQLWVLAYQQSGGAKSLDWEELVGLMGQGWVDRNALVMAFLSKVDGPVAWSEFVDAVEDFVGPTPFYDHGHRRHEPLSQQVREFFYSCKTAGELAGRMDQLQKDAALAKVPLADLPRLRADQTIESFFRVAQQELDTDRKLWATKPAAEGAPAPGELTERRLHEINARLLVNQADRLQGGTGLVLTAGTDAQPPASASYSLWGQLQKPARASPGFTHDALELQQQLMRALPATGGLLPLYAAVCAGRLHPNSSGSSYASGGPVNLGPSGRPQPAEVDEHTLRIMSGLWLDEVVDRLKTPATAKLVLDADPAVYEEAIGAMPFWLLLVAETMYACLLRCLDENNSEQGLDDFARALEQAAADISGGKAVVPNNLLTHYWPSGKDALEVLTVEPPVARRPTGGRPASDVPWDVVNPLDQLLDFGTVFLPLLDQTGILRDLYDYLSPYLSKAAGGGVSAARYETLCKHMCAMPARKSYLRPTSDVDYEAEALQLVRQQLQLPSLCNDLIGSYGQRTAPVFEADARAPGGAALRVRNEQQFLNAYGTARGAQSVCLKAGVTGLLTPPAVAEQISDRLNEAHGGHQWLAGVFSPSQIYLPNRLTQSAVSGLPGPNQAIKAPRAALAMLHRQLLTERPFFWAGWYVRSLAMLQLGPDPVEDTSVAVQHYAGLVFGKDAPALEAAARDSAAGSLVGQFWRQRIDAAKTVAHLYHPEDLASWHAAWRHFAGDVPTIALFTPELVRLSRESTKVKDVAAFEALVAECSKGLLNTLQKLQEELLLPAKSPDSVETEDRLAPRRGAKASAELLQYLTDTTAKADEDEFIEVLRLQYKRYRSTHEHVVQPALSSLAMSYALLGAELDEVADAVFEVLSRALSEAVGAPAKAADQLAAADACLIALKSQPELIALLRQRPEWIFQLGQHLCALPGFTVRLLGIYWAGFVLEGVLGDQFALRMQIVNAIERSLDADHTGDVDLVLHTPVGRAMARRVHESAACAVSGDPGQGDVRRLVALQAPGWRQALSLFCDRCSHHSRNFLRERKVKQFETPQQLRYHERVAGELGVGVAHMSDHRLLLFAVYILLGNVQPLTSAPMDPTRAAALSNIAQLLDVPMMAHGPTRRLLLQQALNNRWLALSDVALGLPKQLADLRQQVDSLPRQVASAEEFTMYADDIAAKCATAVQRVTPAGVPIRPAGPDDQTFQEMEAGALDRLKQMPARVPPASMVELQRDLLEDSVQRHAALTKALDKLPGVETKKARYLKYYPQVRDLCLRRDICEALSGYLRQRLSRWTRFAHEWDERLRTWYRACGVRSVYAFRYALDILSDQAAGLKSVHDGLVQSMAEVQQNVASGSDAFTQLLEIKAYETVAVLELNNRGIAHDAGVWASANAQAKLFRDAVKAAEAIQTSGSFAAYSAAYTALQTAVPQDIMDRVGEVEGEFQLLTDAANIAARLHVGVWDVRTTPLSAPLTIIETVVEAVASALETCLVAAAQLQGELAAVNTVGLTSSYDKAIQLYRQAVDPANVGVLNQIISDATAHRYANAVRKMAGELETLRKRYKKDVVDAGKTLAEDTFSFVGPLQARLTAAVAALTSVGAFPDPATSVEFAAVQSASDACLKAVTDHRDNKATDALLTAVQALNSTEHVTLSQQEQGFRDAIRRLEDALARYPANKDLSDAVQLAKDPTEVVQTELAELDKLRAEWTAFVADLSGSLIPAQEAAVTTLEQTAIQDQGLLQFVKAHQRELAQLRQLETDTAAFAATMPAHKHIAVHRFIRSLTPGAKVSKKDVSIADLSGLTTVALVQARKKAIADNLPAAIANVQANAAKLETAAAGIIADGTPLLQREDQAELDFAGLAPRTPDEETLDKLIRPDVDARLLAVKTSLHQTEELAKKISDNAKELRDAEKFAAKELPKLIQQLDDLEQDLVNNSARHQAAQLAAFETLSQAFTGAWLSYQPKKPEMEDLARRHRDNGGVVHAAMRDRVFKTLDALAAWSNNPAAGGDRVALGEEAADAIKALEQQVERDSKLLQDVFAVVTAAAAQSLVDIKAVPPGTYDAGSPAEQARQEALARAADPLFANLLQQTDRDAMQHQQDWGVQDAVKLVSVATHLYSALIGLSGDISTFADELKANGGKLTHEALRKQVKQLIKQHLAAAEASATALHQLLADATDRSLNGTLLEVATLLAKPESSITDATVAQAGNKAGMERQIKAAALAFTAAPAQKALQDEADRIGKEATDARTLCDKQLSPLATHGDEPRHVLQISKNLLTVIGSMSSKDFRAELAQFDQDLKQLVDQAKTDAEAIQVLRQDIKTTVEKERANLPATLGTDVDFFSKLPPATAVKADDASYAPINKARVIPITKLLDYPATFGKLWTAPGKGEWFTLTNVPPLNEKDAKHAAIANKISRAAFIAIQQFYYRTVEWGQVFGDPTNWPASVPAALKKYAAWAGDNYDKWVNFIQKLNRTETGGMPAYVDLIALYGRASVSQIIDLGAIPDDLPGKSIDLFLQEMEAVDMPAAINAIAQQAVLDKLPFVTAEPYASAVSSGGSGVSPWMDPIYDRAMNPGKPPAAGPAPRPTTPPGSRRPPPPPLGGPSGSGSGGGGGGPAPAPKVFFRGTPKDATEVTSDKMFNFFAPDLLAPSPDFFNKDWFNYWRKEEPFDSNLPDFTLSSGKPVEPSKALEQVMSSTATQKDYVNRRLGFLYMAYLKYVERNTQLIGYNFSTGTVERTGVQWLETASGMATSYARELQELMDELLRACQFDLQPVYSALRSAKDITVIPEFKVPVWVRRSINMETLTAGRFAEIMNRFSQGYFFTRQMAAKHIQKGDPGWDKVQFHLADSPNNTTPQTSRDSKRGKISAAPVHGVYNYGNDNDGDEVPEVRLDPRFARGPRI